MTIFTPAELALRRIILDSQKDFTKFLKIHGINKLLYLFGEKYDEYININQKVTKYVELERKIKGLDDNDVIIKSKYYGHDDNNSSLNLEIFKNNKLFIYLNIHLAPNNLDSKESGMIHIYKSIYEGVKPTDNRSRYALIRVDKPNDKPKSLVFSIGYGWNTPGIPIGHPNEIEIQQEMSVIINVLNQMFDEDNKKMYIGDEKHINIRMFPILTNTTIVSKNMNTRRKHTERGNVGLNIIPNRVEQVENIPPQIPVITNTTGNTINLNKLTNKQTIINSKNHIIVNRDKYKPTRKKSNRTTRKKKK